jgi:Ca-activated chloride channel family protein
MTEWHSWWAFLFVPVLFAVLGYRFFFRQKLVSSLRFSVIENLRTVNRGLRSRWVEVPLILKGLALLLAILALARPQESSTNIKRNVEGIDIMVVLDISDSMLIEDMQPENRIESSKKFIGEFIQGRSSDRIGLIIFSGESYTRVPLTLDYPLLLDNLKKVTISRNIKMGTAIGVALANAVARLKDSTTRSRLIVFMTDGENNSGTIDPETALEIAKGYGIKIYSVGMGRDGESMLPVFVTDATGRTVKQYRPIHSDINVPLLQKFADRTGGRFWRATEGTQLKDVFRDIDQLEKTKISTDKFTRYAELFQPYLRWAVIFYFLSMVLSRSVFRRKP